MRFFPCLSLLCLIPDKVYLIWIEMFLLNIFQRPERSKLKFHFSFPESKTGSSKLMNGLWYLMWGPYFILESLPVHVNICGQLICMCLQGRPSKIPPLSQPWQKYFSKRNMGVEEDHTKYLFAFVPARFWHSGRYLKWNKKITKKLHWCF